MFRLIRLFLAMALPNAAFATESPAAPTEQVVGGALTSWSSVPIADDATRAAGSVNVWGQVQSWATVADQDVALQADPATYGDPEADPGFSVPRAGFGIDGFLPMGDRANVGQVDYAVSIALGAPYDALTDRLSDIQIGDAFGRWAKPWSFGTTSLAVGLQRVPFGREALMSSAHLVFQERAVATHWLTPSRDAGATASQSFTFGDGGPSVLIRGGVYNGNGDPFGDQDPGVMAVARAEFLLGDAYRTWSYDLSPALGVGGGMLRNPEIATTTVNRQIDALARWKWFTAFGELITSQIQLGDTSAQRPDVLDAVNRVGFTGQLSVFLPVGSRSGVEVAARYATLDDDRDVTSIGDVAIVHAGLTWRDLAPGLDVGGGYIHRRETPSFTNDTVRLWVQVRPSKRL